MLTRDDLNQFRKVIREEIENETKVLKDELGSDITMARMRLQADINELKDRIKNLEIGMTNLESKITRMHKELKSEIKLIVTVLDKENLKTLKRVEKIEQNLSI